MRNLLLALLLVSLVPVGVLARGRHHCGSGYRAPRAPRVSYRGYGYSRGYTYRGGSRGGYYSIFHDDHAKPRVIPQPSAPSAYPAGQYPTLIHSPGVEYLNPTLAPAPAPTP